MFKKAMVMAALAGALWAPVPSLAWVAPESEIDPAMLKVDEQEYLGVAVSADTVLVDDQGKRFTFRDIRDKATILVLSYYSCDGFCPSFNAALLGVLKKVSEMEQVSPGKDFRILTVSFDANDGAAEAATFKKGLGLTDELAENWTVATFADPEKDLAPFTKSLGYPFFWSRPDRMFFHPNVYYFVSPDEGRVTRIMHGANVDAKDMELAILDAKFKKIKPSEILHMAVSLCYSYNYKEGKYGLNYPAFFAFGSLFLGITAFAFAARQTKKMQKHKQEVRRETND
ncbi:MAG: SCO family protein [Nitrospinae bacterium]|nr:SCO family protein [Nitrospinota bacterium]